MSGNGSQIGIAAGIIKHARHVDARLPALVNHITFGSYTPQKHEGNRQPTYFFNPETESSINAVGLSNEGIAAFMHYELPELIHLGTSGCTIRVSLAPREQGELREMLDFMRSERLTPYIQEIEVNAACPNHRNDAGKLHDVLACDPVALENLMSEVGKKPPAKMAIKIAPDMKEGQLSHVVELAQKFNFTSIVSGNARRGSSVIGGVQRLSVESGGIGGSLLFKDSLEQVRILRRLLDASLSGKNIRLIGCGGIMNGMNIRSYLNAGADLIQIATYFMQYETAGVRDLLQESVQGSI